MQFCIYLCSLCILSQTAIIGSRYYFFDILDKKINNVNVSMFEDKMIEFYVNINFICDMFSNLTVIVVVFTFFEIYLTSSSTDIFVKYGCISIIMLSLDVILGRLVIKPLCAKLRELA